MSLPVLICDDSALARKAIARSLPKDWDISITFAENGALGLDAVRKGKGNLIFLDLNMPIMDGYEVLDTIKKEDLPSLVIVISGDIQPEAHKKVSALGALDFIKKPIDQDILLNLLSSYGLYKAEEENTLIEEDSFTNVNLRDALQEISNIAMGRAGDLLARLLDVFVLLPIPNVNTLEISELHMALTDISTDTNISAVSQGFISSGINGEALMIFHDSSFADIAKLLKYNETVDDHIQIEVMNDISNILIGAFLNGLAEQLDIHFSQGQPNVLGQHCHIDKFLQGNKNQLQKTLAIEVNYKIENYNIQCDLLLLFTEDSIETLTNKLGYLID